MRKFYVVLLFLLVNLSLFSQTNIFPTSGNVGVGTLNPLTPLHSIGHYNMIQLRLERSGSYTGYCDLGGSNGDFRVWAGGYNKNHKFVVLGDNGNLGIGTLNPQVNLHIHHGSEMSAYLRLESQHVGQNASVQFCSEGTYRWELGTGISAQSAFELYDRTDGVSRLVVLDGGNIGIGTTSPDYKLDVLGTIRARELKVDMQGADFVFEEDYLLRPISELEDFVKVNKHLPEIAPAKEMQENGVNQSEMNQKLLQKIEELTLYLIEQNKLIKYQGEEIKELKKNRK